jgi:Lipocalin-like domain
MNRLRIVMLAIAALMAPATLAHGQQAVTKDKIIGTWKLLSFYDESIESGKKANVFGGNPRGHLILTLDDRIALINGAASREAPKGQLTTDTEAAGLFKTMIAYIGKYEIDPTPTEAGTKIILRAEMASNPLIEGRDRGFYVSVDGNKLIFRTNPPAPSPLTGEVSTRNVIWEREQ